jgi:flagellar secretion chaperone FliS
MDAYRQYQTQAVTTATPGQLVAMLYQGALAAVYRAEQTLRAGDAVRVESVHHDLVKAQDILAELSLSLDHAAGGEIAANLAALYDFCTDRLVRANLTKDPELLPAVSRILGELATTWDEVMRQTAPAMAAAVG